MKTLISALLFFVLISCNKPEPPPPPAPPSAPILEVVVSPEEKAIEKAVNDCYQNIGFIQSRTPDYDLLRESFTPRATFINFRGGDMEYLTIDEFMSEYEQAVKDGAFSSVSERETFGKTEYFGKIAHRISAYETYMNDSEEVAEFGVNSFQLINIDGAWKINSVIWDVEREDLPIPKKYK